MNKIAIIPARSGSKRIPHKNVIDFMGKPLLVWTIEAALKSGLFDQVLVSTDSETIAQIAIENGAFVPFLRETAYDDESPVSLATCAALRQCSERFGEHYDIVTQLMPNTPLRTAQDIQNAMARFFENRAASQISCFKFGWMNPWWAVKLDPMGRPETMFPEAQEKRSQDLPELYCPTGAIWIAKTDVLLKYQTFYLPGHIFEPIPWRAGVDIDDDDDLAIAKAVFLMHTERL